MVALSACGLQNAQAPPAVDMPGPGLIVPTAAEGIALFSEAEGSGDRRLPSVTVNPRVTLPAEIIAHQTIDTNIDLDDAEEQIIIGKRRDDPEDRIRLMVADFDPLRNTYVISWQGVTSATNLRTYSVYVIDMTGDHNAEIVFIGVNNQGFQTLNAYRRLASRGGFGAFFEPIIAVQADVSVEVASFDRGEAYDNFLAPGMAFPVVTMNSSQNGANRADIVKTTYIWQFSEGRYFQGLLEVIPSILVAEAQIQELLDGTMEDFERFLGGPWYRVDAGDTPQRPAVVTESQDVLFFDPALRAVRYSQGQTQKSFLWESSHKAAFGGRLVVYLASEIMPTLESVGTITAVDPDQITFSLQGIDTWSAQFRRLSRPTQVARTRSPVVPIDMELTGLYRATDGYEIYFAPPHFTLRNQSEHFEGTFVGFIINAPVLEMSVLGPSGTVTESRFFEVQVDRAYSAAGADRLTLWPAELDIFGVDRASDRPIILDQVIENHRETD